MRSFRRDSSVTKRKLPAGTLRRIAAFARPYRRAIVSLVSLLALDAAIGAVNPLIFRAIINQGILGHRSGLVVVLALIVGGIAFFDAGLSLVERFFSARIGEGLIFDMRTKVFSHIQRMPIAFFTRTQTGALISRLDNDVLGAQSAFTGTLSSVVTNVFTLAITLGVMFTLSWQITLVALVLLPLFILPARRVGRRLQAITRESYNLNAAMTATMSERFNVAGALLTKLFGRPAEEDAGFAERAGRVRDIGVTSGMYNQVFFAAIMLVASLATAVVYGWGGWLAARGALDVGTVVALTSYLTRLYGPLTQLSNVNVDVMTALVSFERVFEVLDLPPMVADRPGAAALPTDAATIEFDAVDFRYPMASEVSLASLEAVATLDSTPDREVLHQVDFRAEPGELVALVGPSGAGKTTIAHLFLRFWDPDKGAARLDGHDLRDYRLDDLCRRVALVAQDTYLFNDTMRNNVRLARPGASGAEVETAIERAALADFVASLPDGLDTVVGERGTQLSGGQRQRVAIARAFLKDAPVLILDEATSHLDAVSEATVRAALDRLKQDRTTLVIAHRLSTVRGADTIVVLDHGRVVEAGAHAELLARRGLYARLISAQLSSVAT
jgi:ATP-binding cassette subfamily B protein